MLRQSDAKVATMKLNENRVRFTVRKNRRIKRDRVVISPEDGIVVETRRRPSIKHAHFLISRRKEWVINTLEHMRVHKQFKIQVKEHKHSVLIFGHEKCIKIKRNQRQAYVAETSKHIILGFTEARLKRHQAKHALMVWLRTRAERYLVQRVGKLNRNRFDINTIYIKDQETMWGSCSSKKNLNLNWRLIMAPTYVSDYIMIHEMCHTRYLNHSKAFWDTVERYCPNYEKAESWLRQFGFVLHMDWVSGLI